MVLRCHPFIRYCLYALERLIQGNYVAALNHLQRAAAIKELIVILHPHKAIGVIRVAKFLAQRGMDIENQRYSGRLIPVKTNALIRLGEALTRDAKDAGLHGSWNSPLLQDVPGCAKPNITGISR